MAMELTQISLGSCVHVCTTNHCVKSTKIGSGWTYSLDVKGKCNFKKWILFWWTDSSKLRRSQFSNEILMKNLNFFCQNGDIVEKID